MSKGHHRSLPVFEGFAPRNFDAYVADPVTASLNALQSLVDAAKLKFQDAENRAKAAKAAFSNEKELKLKAEKNGVEVQSLLTTTQGDLTTRRKLRDDMVKENDAELEELKNRFIELEPKEKTDSEEIASLQNRIVELEASLKKAQDDAASSSDPAGRIVELEDQLKKEKENVFRAAKAALAMMEKDFQKASEEALMQASMQAVVVNLGLW